MAVTHKLIQTTTVGAGGAASIEFTSIPQTYTDLLVVVSGRSTDASQSASVKLIFNNGTGNDSRYLQGNAISATSAVFSAFAGFVPAATATASVFGSMNVYIPNYTGSTNKSFSVDAVSENNDSSGGIFLTLTAGLWQNTAAITSMKFSMIFGSNYAQYSSASLYGILKS